MLFSVIIPVFNTGKDLHRSLKSILTQDGDFNDYEVIVIDDGSTDKETLQILDDYHNKFSIVKLIKQNNSGGVAARRMGIQYATGTYVTFLDSDDKVTSNYMKILHDMVVEEADIYLFNNYLARGENDLQIEKNDCVFGNGFSIDDFLRKIFCVQMNAVWDKIYLRENFEPVSSLLEKNIMYGDDMYMNAMYLSNKPIQKFFFYPKPLYIHYIDTATSVSCAKSTMKRIFDTCVCLKAVSKLEKVYPHINGGEYSRDFCFGYIVRHLRRMISQGDEIKITDINNIVDDVELFKAKSIKAFFYRLSLKYGLYKLL